MTYSQKYTLVSFVDSISVGTEFDMADWPPHVTLADVFAIDRSGTNIDAKLAAMTAELLPIIANADKEAVLGTVHVTLLDKTEPLLQLHRHLVDLLEANGVVFNNPEFTRDGYLPHCTIQKTGRLRRGEKVTIDNLALIDMFPASDWQRRKVTNLFMLSGRLLSHARG